MAANKHPHAGPGRTPMEPERRMRNRVVIPVSDALYARIQHHARMNEKSMAALLRDMFLAAELVSDNPLAAIRAMATDPNASRTRVTRRPATEPESMPLPFGPQKKRTAAT